jgi:3-mercaptopyruvate sulfurtransferase SseA
VCYVGLQVVDARPAGRFAGVDPEPRPGLPSGHMPGAKSVPFMQVRCQHALHVCHSGAAPGTAVQQCCAKPNKALHSFLHCMVLYAV